MQGDLMNKKPKHIFATKIMFVNIDILPIMYYNIGW
jgi:hypothetical protein